MSKEITTEVFGMNEAIKDLLKCCDTVAQLAALADLQEHFVKLYNLIKE